MSADLGTVFVIDDDAFVREFVIALLKRERPEINIKSYNNAAAAIADLQTAPPDLVLLDVSMPLMDGYEAAPLIRQKIRSTVPIIILTAEVIERNGKDLDALGITGVISKPFNPDAFLDRLRGFLNAEAE